MSPNGIPADLLATYLENIELYELYGKEPPRHYEETIPGEVTVYSYAQPEVGVTYQEPLGTHIFFEPRGAAPPEPVSYAEVGELGEVLGEMKPYGEVVEAGFGLGLLGLVGGLIGGLIGGETIIEAAAPLVGELLGGDDQMTTEVIPGEGGAVVMNGGAVPVSGPGVPEPPRAMVAKQWSIAVRSNTYGTFRVFFFKLVDGRVMCYNPSTKSWKMWRPKKPLAVMYRGKTTLSEAVKVQKYLDKMWKQVAKKTKALKLA
ncbi:hypothetical protein ES703_79382 [subsurface metagenome]